MGPQLETAVSPPAEDQFTYRSISIAAVVSGLLGLASFVTLAAGANSIDAALVVSIVPLAGIILGVHALLHIRRAPETTTGMPVAWAGIVLSLGFLVSGIGYASWVYATEVPKGYERITFSNMKPDEIEKSQGIIVPPEIRELDGKKIFIKGYMRPPAHTRGIDSFLLVRDNNECCFGKLEDLNFFDQVQVRLRPPLLTDYHERIYKVAGKLKIDPDAHRQGQPVYTLTADRLQ